MEPLEVVKRFGEAWGAHDLDATLAMVTDDFVFESTGPGPDGVRAEGREAARAAWVGIFEDASATFETEETFAAGVRVVQRWCYRWTDGHVRGVDLFKIRGDLVAEKLSYVKG